MPMISPSYPSFLSLCFITSCFFLFPSCFLLIFSHWTSSHISGSPIPPSPPRQQFTNPHCPSTPQSSLCVIPPSFKSPHPPTVCTFSSLNFPFSSSPSSLYAPYPHIPPPFSLRSPTALPFPRSFPPLLSPLYSCTKDSCWSKNPGSQMAVVVLYIYYTTTVQWNS